MTFEKIGVYLEKLKGIVPPDKYITNTIKKSILDNVGVSVDHKDIKIFNFSVVVKTKNSSEKNEVFINKERVLKDVIEKLGEGKIKELRVV